MLRAVGTTQLRMCYDSLAAQAGGTVLALDRVRFDGQEAILLVISLPGQGNAARLVVIDAHCGVVPVSSAVLYSVNASRA
ncbi:hypothetical protein UG55_105810 [Frankia sp. EI5c]|nr:hypothetical protein UG55_105810 [Frankia sp. EI5c]